MADINILTGESKEFVLDGKLSLIISLSGNLLYANLFGFDTFTFITTENKLLKKTDLIYYNNLNDERSIVIEKNDLETWNTEIELKIDLKEKRFKKELIEIYLRLAYHQRTKSVFDFFWKKARKKITIEFQIRNECNLEILKGEVKTYLCETIKFLTIKKVNISVAELSFVAERIDTNIEGITNQKFNHE